VGEEPKSRIQHEHVRENQGRTTTRVTDNTNLTAIMTTDWSKGRGASIFKPTAGKEDDTDSTATNTTTISLSTHDTTKKQQHLARSELRTKTLPSHPT
jgi:hypothetical protein